MSWRERADKKGTLWTGRVRLWKVLNATPRRVDSEAEIEEAEEWVDLSLTLESDFCHLWVVWYWINFETSVSSLIKNKWQMSMERCSSVKMQLKQWDFSLLPTDTLGRQKLKWLKMLYAGRDKGKWLLFNITGRTINHSNLLGKYLEISRFLKRSPRFLTFPSSYRTFPWFPFLYPHLW